MRERGFYLNSKSVPSSYASRLSHQTIHRQVWCDIKSCWRLGISSFLAKKSSGTVKQCPPFCTKGGTKIFSSIIPFCVKQRNECY